MSKFIITAHSIIFWDYRFAL